MAKKVKRPSDWSKVTWTNTHVVAFDPSLANTGWVLVHFLDRFAPVIGARGTFTTTPEQGSTEGILGSLERGDLIYTFANDLLRRMDDEYWRKSGSHGLLVAVHEVPVNQANAAHVHKAEAGPVSAMALRAAMRANGIEPEPIEVQTWKKYATGNGHADKDEVARVVTEVFPNLGRSNEHVRDALGCALGFMIKAERWTEHE